MEAKKKEFKAQSLSEYSIFLALVLVATIAMSAYVRRGIQGKYMALTILPAKVASGSLSKSFVLSNQNPQYVVYDQYDPAYAKSRGDIQTGRQENVKYSPGGKIEKTIAPSTTLTTMNRSDGIN
jgi:hypothetical protein